MISQETVSRVNKAFFRHKREKGNKGEDIACVYLERQGFKVIVRNFRKKWGELDIVAQKEGIIHFFEVKSVIVKDIQKHMNRSLVSPLFADSHRPEENVHDFKMRHIRRMIQTFLTESNRGLGEEFHFHVLCIYMNVNTRRARVKWIKDVIL